MILIACVFICFFHPKVSLCANDVSSQWMGFALLFMTLKQYFTESKSITLAFEVGMAYGTNYNNEPHVT